MKQWLLLAAVALLLLAPNAGADEFVLTSGLRLEQVASGLSSPLYLTAPPSDPRLFIVEQPGRIRIVRDGQLLATPFLDIRSRIRSGGERGLLSVAFHPDYASNGFFYVNYTDLQGATRVERYQVGSDPDAANPDSAKLILMVPQPFANHNGGLNKFGPDGMLWIGMGDGGGAGDPQRHGQNRQSLHGKMLRIDVNGGDPYAIPPDNPFINSTDTRPEIWALGLRNPWRFSFDRATGDLYVGDVGQNALEEIDVEPAGEGGRNYGWPIMEGTRCFDPPSGCDTSGLTLPVLDYGRDAGCSVTGGYVYRGSAIPGLVGRYLYGDYCSNRVWTFRWQDGVVSEHVELTDDLESTERIEGLTSFGEDAAGEFYLVSQGGAVYRIEAE